MNPNFSLDKLRKKNNKNLKRTTGKSFDEDDIILTPKEFNDICNTLDQCIIDQQQNKKYEKLLLKYQKKLNNLNKEFKKELFSLKNNN